MGCHFLLQGNLPNPGFEPSCISCIGSRFFTTAPPGKESVKVLVFSHVRLCDPKCCSLPGSFVHGILQARTLEQIAIHFSGETSQSRADSLLSEPSGKWRSTLGSTIWEAPDISKQLVISISTGSSTPILPWLKFFILIS